MKKQTLWLTSTALMLALLITLQSVTRGLGQIATGTCVNAVLAVSTLLIGLSGGLTVALLSPIFAFLLGIAPQLVTVPAIMAGNAAFVLVLSVVGGRSQSIIRRIAAWLTSSAAKFAVLHILVVRIICGTASSMLMAQGILKAPMLDKLPAMFTWPQLITALIGGGLALLITPIINKALHRR